MMLDIFPKDLFLLEMQILSKKVSERAANNVRVETLESQSWKKTFAEIVKPPITTLLLLKVFLEFISALVDILV